LENHVGDAGDEEKREYDEPLTPDVALERGIVGGFYRFGSSARWTPWIAPCFFGYELEITIGAAVSFRHGAYQ